MPIARASKGSSSCSSSPRSRRSWAKSALGFLPGYYDVTEHGNWEGTNILHTPESLEVVARDLGVEGAPDELRARLAADVEKVYAARLLRVPPLLDDKVLAAWNGLMISAMAFGFARSRRRALRGERRARRRDDSRAS